MRRLTIMSSKIVHLHLVSSWIRSFPPSTVQKITKIKGNINFHSVVKKLDLIHNPNVTVRNPNVSNFIVNVSHKVIFLYIKAPYVKDAIANRVIILRNSKKFEPRQSMK